MENCRFLPPRRFALRQDHNDFCFVILFALLSILFGKHRFELADQIADNDKKSEGPYGELSGHRLRRYALHEGLLPGNFLFFFVEILQNKS